MNSVIFLGGRKHTHNKGIIRSFRKESINLYTGNRSRGQSESYGQNLQGLGRELMTMNERTTMPGDKCILQLLELPRSYLLNMI